MSVFIDANKILTAKDGQLPYTYLIDLRNSDYDQNIWYPVMLLPNPFTTVNAKVETSYIRPEHINAYMILDEAQINWGTHKGSAGGNLNCIVYTSNWGAIKQEKVPGIILSCENNWVKDNKNPITIQRFDNNNGITLFMRGGGYYHIESDFQHNPFIVKDSYTANEQTIVPTKNPTNDPKILDLTNIDARLKALESHMGGVNSLYYSCSPELEVA